MTELDLRYLGQTTVGPGALALPHPRRRPPCPPVQVELVDLATDRVTTLAYTRAVPGRGRLSAMVARFDRDTAVTPTGDGTYAARIDPGWWIERGPNGGYVAAVLVQALTAEVADPDRHLRSLTVHYLAPAREGAAEVTVHTERAGRTISFLDARLQQGDRLLATARAAFAVQNTGSPAFADPTFPGYPPPETLAVRPDPPGMVAMRDRYEYHHVVGLPWEGPSDQAETGGWIRLREPRPYDAALVAALSDAWYPADLHEAGQPDGRAHHRPHRARPLGRRAATDAARRLDGRPLPHDDARGGLPRGGRRAVGARRHARRPLPPARPDPHAPDAGSPSGSCPSPYCLAIATETSRP